MKRIKVRRHKRRKRSGGATIVRSHLRQIERKRLKAYPKHWTKEQIDARETLRKCWQCKEMMEFDDFMAANAGRLEETQAVEWWLNPKVQLFCCNCFDFQETIHTGVLPHRGIRYYYETKGKQDLAKKLFNEAKMIGYTNELPFWIEAEIDFDTLIEENPQKLMNDAMERIITKLNMNLIDLKDIFKVSWNLLYNNAEVAMPKNTLPIFHQSQTTEHLMNIGNAVKEYIKLDEEFGMDKIPFQSFKEVLSEQFKLSDNTLYIPVNLRWVLFTNKEDFFKKIIELANIKGIKLDNNDIEIIKDYKK